MGDQEVQEEDAFLRYGGWGVPLQALTTEADCGALAATTASLAHVRAVKQLASVLGCEATWSSVQAELESKRQQEEVYEDWVKSCLSSICTFLVDNLIGDERDHEPYIYFNKFGADCKRLVRMEYMAAKLINQACQEYDHPEKAFSSFIMNLKNAITENIADPMVAGFKSAIYYRTGLGISHNEDKYQAFVAFQKIHTKRGLIEAEPLSRLQDAGLNDLGENDITLTKASPSYLQSFIKQYPTVPIIFLQSGHPFVREMGYLATVYANVYTDIGLVFPMVSRDGQEKVIRQVLELCPSSKILWSTGGHYLPETYLLAVTQMRKAFETVLSEYVKKEDLTWIEARDVVENVLFRNSNKLYSLGLDLNSPPPVLTPQSESAQAELDKAGPDQEKEQSEYESQSDQLDSDRPTPNFDGLAKLKSAGDSIQYVRLCWHDITGTTRGRTIPIRRAMSILQSKPDFKFSVSTSALALLQTDEMLPGVSPAEEWDLCADFESLRVGPRKGLVTVMGDFQEKDGSSVLLCPRTTLADTLRLASSHNLEFILGFEIEFVLLKRTGVRQFEMLDGDAHGWCSVRAADHDAAIAVEEAVSKLDKAGIYVETIHPESAFGQYEIVLPAAPALEAVDTLIFARQVLSACADSHGYKMTLHPKPYAKATGTAAHVHMSISSPRRSDRDTWESFYAGILKHLRSLLAYTCASPVSYSRLVDGCWAGGTWVAWGCQNRETPLRKIEDSHWELKCMDGLANPYLAMAAIFSAGIDGVELGQKLLLAECTNDPATLTEEQRKKLNITEKLPATLLEALESLEKDDSLREIVGGDSVERYIAVKKAEMKMLSAMDDSAQRQWIIERY
uniref:Glutamine synthetase n=1 Tax=Bionectria ochroleuca TaxID=29856 RepID=A0A8H7K6I8_BIOOC